MKINLHIERLVLDGYADGSLDGDSVRTALGTELARLLRELPPAAAGSALAQVRLAVPGTAGEGAQALGTGVARALHGVLVPAAGASAAGENPAAKTAKAGR